MLLFSSLFYQKWKSLKTQKKYKTWSVLSRSIQSGYTEICLKQVNANMPRAIRREWGITNIKACYVPLC